MKPDPGGLAAAEKVIEAAREWVAAERALGKGPCPEVGELLHRRRLAVHALMESVDALSASSTDGGER